MVAIQTPVGIYLRVDMDELEEAENKHLVFQHYPHLKWEFLIKEKLAGKFSSVNIKQ